MLVILLSDIPAIQKVSFLEKQKNANLYADAYSDDNYWKLQFQFKLASIKENEKIYGQSKIDSPIGWVYGIDPESYMHAEISQLGTRRPVLLYGDSYARCAPRQDCFQDILNKDEDFSRGRYLLNYGQNGYGVDQIFLLFKNSVDRYKDPFVVISIMPKDLDRSILTFRGRPKPYFTIQDGNLHLNEIPLNAALLDFYSENPVRISSYLYRRALFSGITKKYLPESFISFLKKEDYYIDKKIRINEKIILETIKELRDRDMDFVFLIYHSRYNSWLTTTDTLDWRDDFLLNLLEENKIPYIWSRRILNNDAKVNRKTKESDYYLSDAHPNSYANRLIAEELKNLIIRTGSK